MPTDGKLQLVIDAEARALIEPSAEAANLSTTPFVIAVVVGAIRRGLADSLLEAGENILTPQQQRRRARPNKLVWHRDPPNPNQTSGAKAPGVWRTGDYVMTRRGSPNKARGFTEAEGWFLAGPGLSEPTRVGVNRTEAMREADAIIQGMRR